MEIFNISVIDSVLETEKRKRILGITENFHDALFLVHHYLDDKGYCVLTKPIDISGQRIIDWYSERAALSPESQNVLVFPSDPVQFFSSLKKIEDMEKLFFHLTPVLFLHEQETVAALIENLCAHFEEKGSLLVLLENQEIFEEIIGPIKNCFDYTFKIADGKLTITSLKKTRDDVEIQYLVREEGVVLRTSNGIERCSVSWCGGKNLFWLPGSELLLPEGVNETSSLYFSCDGRTKQYLVEQLVADTILSKKPCIFVSGDTTFKEFAERLKLRKKLEIGETKNFVFIDWFSCTAKKVTEVEDRGRELLVSRDIVYLGVAIDWAVKKLEGNGVLVLDCLTSGSQFYTTEEICSFLATVVARAKRKGYSVVSFGNLEVIGRQRTKAFAFFFDGHIAINEMQVRVEHATTFFARKQKFAVAVAADVLSVIPLVEKDVELSEEEIARVLKVLDELLENLPDEKISEFAQREEFRMYEKLLKKYGI